MKYWSGNHLHGEVADECSLWKKHCKGCLLAVAEVLVHHLRLHHGPAVPQLDHGRGVVPGHLGRLRNSPRRREITLLLDRCSITGTGGTCSCAGATTCGAYSHWRFIFVFGCKQISQDGEQFANLAVAILIWIKRSFDFLENIHLSLELAQQVGQLLHVIGGVSCDHSSSESQQDYPSFQPHPTWATALAALLDPARRLNLDALNLFRYARFASIWYLQRSKQLVCIIFHIELQNYRLGWHNMTCHYKTRQRSASKVQCEETSLNKRRLAILVFSVSV